MPASRTAAEALSLIQSGQRVFVHGGAATPNRLLEGLVERAPELRDVELMHLHTHGPAHYADPSLRKSFRVTNLFVGENIRPHLDMDRIDVMPCFLSEIPQIFRSGRRKPDVALIHVSPPDAHGYCTLGTSVDVARAAVDTADIVIAQINRRMPRVHGEGFIHSSRINAFIEVDEPLPESKPCVIGPEEKRIGELVASLIPDGATIQAGIGAVPDAVLSSLHGHKHLGFHTEMWSDHALSLIESGAVDNSRKVVHPGVTVSSFVVGTKRVYDAIHDNPFFVQLPADEVNNPSIIARNPCVAAINSAVEIDLTGQVCADSVGSRIISGFGGQVDFIRGASLSKGGVPVIAIRCRTAKGHSKIVPTLRPGSGVVTTRAHVHFVVTEYGIADLYGKTISERAKSLIAIAHPEDREHLEKSWFDLFRKGAL